MATFVSPTPHILQRPQSFSTSFSNHTHHQRLHLARASTSPIRRRIDQRPETQQVAANGWSFEQRLEEALNVLELMEAQAMEPDPSLYCTLIKSCTDAENLEFGKIIHSKIVGTKFENHVFVANNLINLYAKCGCLETARDLFDKMPVRNTVSWTTVISMYSQSGSHEEALRLYSSMKLDPQVRPNVFTYTIALNSCAKTGNLSLGIEIREDVKRDGCQYDAFIATALVDLFSKCGRIDRARRVFDMIEEPGIATCTAMVEGYNANNQGKEAMNLIRRILGSDFDFKLAKEMGFTCLLRSCTMEAALRQGQEIHAHMIKFGYNPGAQTTTSLVLLYEKCDKIASARRLFNELLVKNVELWARMISGYVRNGLNHGALELYYEMICEDVKPNAFTLSYALNACVGISCLNAGKEIHGRAIKAGFGFSENCIIASVSKLYMEFELVVDVHKIAKGRRK